MNFLAPGLLGALGLISVPIVIHLLNKRRVRVVDWAPMELLKLTVRTSKRRVRLEQLLLLLMRCVVVALLAMAIARPVLSGGGKLAWLSGSSRAARVVLFDDSLSMGLVGDDGVAFESAREIAQTVLESISARDALSFLLATRPGEPLLADVEGLEPEARDALLAELVPSDASARFGPALEAAARRLEASPYPVRELTVITDMAAAGWDVAVGEAASRLSGLGVRLVVVDVGMDGAQDVALLSLSPEPGAAVAGQPVRFEAELHNAQAQAFGPASAELVVGDARRTIGLPRMEPGERTSIAFDFSFPEAGVHALSLSLPEDALPSSSTRFSALHVRDSLDVLLVDGDPSPEAFASETDFLAASFGVGRFPWRIYVQTDAEWLANAPPEVDLLVLAGVGTLEREHVDEVARMVEEGMGLFLFPGDSVDSELWELMLGQDGADLLPARVVGPRDMPVRGLIVEPYADSPLAALSALAPGALEGIEAQKTLEVHLEDRGVDAEGREAVRVLARWDDPELSPAVIERRLGRGRVVLFTISADRAWSDWPLEPTFLLSLREAARRAADPGLTELSLEAGARITLEAPSGARPRIDGPDGEPLGELVPEQDAPERYAWGETATAGIYTASWTGADGTAVERRFALSPATDEFPLARIERGGLESLCAPLVPEVIAPGEVERLLDGPGREAWRGLLTALLAIAALESAFALWVGRRG